MDDDRSQSADVEALSIGAVLGGPDASAEWGDAVRNLGKRVIDRREGFNSPLGVNVVFQIPGRYLQPDFEGVRTGRFSSAASLLLVQVALPEKPAQDADAEARDFLMRALDAAETFARGRGIGEGELSELRDLVASL